MKFISQRKITCHTGHKAFINSRHTRRIKLNKTGNTIIDKSFCSHFHLRHEIETKEATNEEYLQDSWRESSHHKHDIQPMTTTEIGLGYSRLICFHAPYKFTHLLTYLINYLHTNLFTYLVTYLHTYTLIYLLTDLLTYLFTYLLTY